MPQRRILLIEDDPDIQKMIQLTLKFQGGHQVTLASDGLEGLAKAAEEQPDAILLDVTMPHMDGYETCRRLKADPATAAIPVIFMSGRAQPSDTQKGLALGAVGYLVKPFDPMTLSDRLDAILGPAGQP